MQENLTDSGCGAQRDRIQNGKKNLVDTRTHSNIGRRHAFGRPKANIELNSLRVRSTIDQQVLQADIPLIRRANLDSLRATRLRWITPLVAPRISSGCARP